MIRSIWLALSFVFAAPLAANGDISADRQRELGNLLIQDCGSCHGLRMKGGLGPALLPDLLRGKSAEYLGNVILNGQPGTAMPPWRPLLSADEATWIAERLLQGKLQ